MSRLTAAALLLSTTACASAAGYGSARPLPPGAQEMTMLGGLTLHRAKLNPGPPVSLPWPQFGVGYRRGVLSGVDAGGRVWGFWLPGFFTLGLAADAKVALVRGEAAEPSWDVALAPTLSWQQANLGGAPTHTLGLSLPLLAGWRLDERIQFVVSPRLSGQLVTSETQHPIVLFFFGTGIGITVPLSETMTLMPEIVVQYTPVSFNGTLDDPSRRGLTTIEFALSGFLDL